MTNRHDRYTAIDSIELRRQLGEISSVELAEVSRVFGGNPVTGYMFTSSMKEPALLIGWQKFEAMAFLGAGVGMGAYARFVRGNNNLWLIAAGMPFCTWALCQRYRQPTTLIDNSYR